MHTENVGSTDLIRAAVVAQLAKPAVEPSAWALLTKGFKWELLTWWGIIGGAITLFVAVSATLKLADWARWLVQHWKEWTHAFWVWAFGWLGIHLPPKWTTILSFLLFWSLLTIGQAVKAKRMTTNKTIDPGKSFPQLISEVRCAVCYYCLSQFPYSCLCLSCCLSDHLTNYSRMRSFGSLHRSLFLK